MNARDRNFTPVTIQRRMEQVDASIQCYLGMLGTADRQEDKAFELRTARLTTRLSELRRQMRELEAMETAVMAGTPALTVLTDRGDFSGPEVLACEAAGITAVCSKPLTSGAKAGGRFGKQDFVYQAESDTYRCPAGETMIRRFSTVANGMTLHGYATPACRSRCTIRANYTASIERRIKRWEPEEVIDAMQARLDRWPDAMRVRRCTVEHVFGTLKDGMGRSDFKMRTLNNVATEASLHILAYNIKRAIALLGMKRLIAAMQA